MKRPDGLLTVTAYAKRRGVHTNAIRRAVKDGRVTLVPGPGGRPMIDPERADRELEENTDPTKPKGRRGIPGPKPKPIEDDDSGDPGDDDEDGEGDIDDGKSPPVHRSIRIKEKYAAKMARLKYLKEQGRLIDADETRAAWLAIITTAKTKIFGIPSKVKAGLPQLTTSDVAFIEQVVRESLEDLADGK